MSSACDECTTRAFASLTVEDYLGAAVDRLYVCRDHLSAVLAGEIEDGNTVEVEAVTR